MEEFRVALFDNGEGPASQEPIPPNPSDGELRSCVEQNQLRLMDRRDIDMVLFSPKASAMAHHVSDPKAAEAWAKACNDLVARVCDLYPSRFAGVCQLPQTPGGGLEGCIAELRRCVEQLGFVGTNLNPDPSGGHWTSPPLTDPYWFDLYEVLEELDVPAMVHVSDSLNPAFHALGAHYINADTTVFMQLLQGDLFSRFPRLRIVIPHGGGAVPYQWGRYQGLSVRLGRQPIEDRLLGNVFFDTCVYTKAAMALLFEVVGASNLLFGSEMLGALRGVNPETGEDWDHTLCYVDSLSLDPTERDAVYGENVRKVYPRLGRRLEALGK